MTNTPEPNDRDEDRDRELDRILRSFNRRINRLEDTQVTWRELNDAFERVYQELDELHDKADSIQTEVREMRSELNSKIDIILRHLTGLDS